MKTLCITLLVATVCLGKAHALWCYRCENEPSNWNCVRSAKCAESEKFCTTIVTTTGLGKDSDYRVSKRCVPTCTENFVDTGRGSVSTKCCESSLCNISGATSVKTSGAAIAVGLLASFLYVLRSEL
uniref:UPAR/Ly6 domain-containing protein n=1 Tax=Salvator merianae TaxID=96440 RepID=A0A8D0BUW5_SALMN